MPTAAPALQRTPTSLICDEDIKTVKEFLYLLGDPQVSLSLKFSLRDLSVDEAYLNLFTEILGRLPSLVAGKALTAEAIIDAAPAFKVVATAARQLRVISSERIPGADLIKQCMKHYEVKRLKSLP